MNTIHSTAALPSGCTPMTSHERTEAELTTMEQTRIAVERSEVLERLQALIAVPKITPPYATLLDCLLDKLSCDQMGVIANESFMTHRHFNAIEQVLVFDLFAAYKHEIKADSTSDMGRHHFLQAVGCTDNKRREEYRTSVLYAAIVERVRESSLIANREASELSEVACLPPVAAHTTVRL
jgi:hypothetical protein